MTTETRGYRSAPKATLRTIRVYCCFCDEFVRVYETYNNYPEDDYGGACEQCVTWQNIYYRYMRSALRKAMPEMVRDFVSELNGNGGEK